jgi:Na+(H+)/acetate symporter ActP
MLFYAPTVVLKCRFFSSRRRSWFVGRSQSDEIRRSESLSEGKTTIVRVLGSLVSRGDTDAHPSIIVRFFSSMRVQSIRRSIVQQCTMTSVDELERVMRSSVSPFSDITDGFDIDDGQS